MPVRPLNREQMWLLPPALDNWIGPEHPVRFVAAFVETLDRTAWLALDVVPEGKVEGAPAYAPAALLGAWVYGFLRGMRSARKLEVACREQVPFLWLTGGQRPDHSTLWRFYAAHRQAMRRLLRRTVRTAVRLNLLDLALQAVDGTKTAGNAAKDRTFDQDGLTKLAERTEAAIADLEAQNQTGGEPTPPTLPRPLRQKEALRQQVQEALATVQAEEGPSRVNLTDADAVLLKGRGGFVCGYNAQVMVGEVSRAPAEGTGRLITAAEVTTAPTDEEQLLPMLHAAEANVGQRVATSLADAGFHAATNLAACAAQGYHVLVAEPREPRPTDPFHKDRFVYEAEPEGYRCPLGQVLTNRGVKHRSNRPDVTIYRAIGTVCRSCPFFGTCTRDARGRSLEIGPDDAALRAQRVERATPAARALYRRRKQLPEPVFGIIKEQQAGRRFLLRGLPQVQAEWSLLATAFNVGTLARIWQRATAERRAQIRSALAA